MFTFQISNYNDPALDMETAKLFQQRLEAHSRNTVPSMWEMTDKLNAYTAKGTAQKTRRVRDRIYGFLLLAVGIFILVPGLMNPQKPILILAGAFAIVVGLLKIYLACKEKTQHIPASCLKAAKDFLTGRRSIDWTEATMKVQFDENGMTTSNGEKQKIIPYEQIAGIFETENLWLLVYDGEKGLLLQKKDLILGDAGEFSSYLHRRVA